MKSILVLSAIASLSIAAPALSQAAVKHAHMMSHHSKMSITTSTTPAVNRPGDADVRSANQKGGVGGKNSSSNGG
jgi:hypothetical protein